MEGGFLRLQYSSGYNTQMLSQTTVTTVFSMMLMARAYACVLEEATLLLRQKQRVGSLAPIV